MKNQQTPPVITIANPKGLGWYMSEATGYVNSKGVLHPQLTKLVLGIYNNLHSVHAMTEEGKAQRKGKDTALEIVRDILFDIERGLASAVKYIPGDDKGMSAAIVTLSAGLSRIMYSLTGYNLNGNNVTLSVKDGFALISGFMDVCTYSSDISRYSILKDVFKAAIRGLNNSVEDSIYFGAILHDLHELLETASKITEETEKARERKQSAAA